jgi:pimeloyl-ACP methyl ester carboxylesterase
MTPASKTFVLVHGAWHGGWCWRRVADILTAKGHKVFTPTLTGLGERSHLMDPKIDLATHIADIANVIMWERLRNVVLCGHSYGGIVISGVVERLPEAIDAMVFLDAFVPADGECMAGLTSPRLRTLIETIAARGETEVAPVSAEAFKVNEADRAWVDASCTPHPLASLVERIALTGARERIARKVYIRARAYPAAAFDAAHARLQRDPAWRVFDLPCGHDAMIDMPEAVADIFAAA